MPVLGECSVLKKGMRRSGWYSSPSTRETSESKGAVNLNLTVKDRVISKFNFKKDCKQVLQVKKN